MLQLRKLRERIPDDFTVFNDLAFEPSIDVADHTELFTNLDKYLAMIPESERYNVFYTLGHGACGSHRDWHKQDVIAFDIDKIDIDEHGNFDNRYLDLFFRAIPCERDKCMIMVSGNGLQILIRIKKDITSATYFKDHKIFYQALINKVKAKYFEAGISKFDLDVSAFEPNRIFRLPETYNVKPKGRKFARLLQGNLKRQDFDLIKISGLPQLKPEDALNEVQLRYFAIDDKMVEEGCQFLNWCKVNPADVNEPQWYAALSILARLEDGKSKCHAYSRGHPSYSEYATDNKIEQATSASGPRTCENIQSIWGLCNGCPHYKKVNSPISLKGEDFIATKDTGFHLLNDKGQFIPQFEDLAKYLAQEYRYRTSKDTGSPYLYDDGHFIPWNQIELKNFAELHFKPGVKEQTRQEFIKKVECTHVIDSRWFNESTENMVNFSNGVLDLKTMELLDHSPDYGFLYKLPYDYDPKEKCPTFDKFLSTVTCGDKDLQQLLLEYIGFAICDRKYWLQKIMLLVGEGSNGKSTFLDIVKELVGDGNSSFLSMGDLGSETHRHQLEGKLINICDEMPAYGAKSTELLKKLTGGETLVRQLYRMGTTMRNSAKFIFAGNQMPATNDFSTGFMRRLIIIPFKAYFVPGKNADPFILDKLRGELPGIYNRVLKAYKDLEARGYFLNSEESEKELATYRDETDLAGAWIKENLRILGDFDDESPFESLTEIYAKYSKNMREGEEKPEPRHKFIKSLRRHVIHYDDRYATKRVGSSFPRVLKGVSMREINEKDLM